MKGEQCRVDQEHIPVFRNIVHLIRNAIDHGIEDEEERESKPDAGAINLTIEQDSEKTVITVSDDGRGINVEKVAQAARDRGILNIEDMTEDIGLLYRTLGLKGLQAIPSVGQSLGVVVEKLILERSTNLTKP